MAVKSITLSVSDRQILHAVLSRQEKVTVKSARMIRELALGFMTGPTSKMLDRINKEARDARVPLPSWEDLANLKMYLGRVNEELTDTDKDATLIALKDYEEILVEPVEASIDSLYLEWVKEKLELVDWANAQMTLPTGETKAVKVPVSVSQAIAIAELADAIDRALA